jgi:hypothetical protein
MQITCDTLWWYSQRGNELFFHTPGDRAQYGCIQCYRPGRRIVSNGIAYRPNLSIPTNIRTITLREAQELFPDFPFFQHGPQPQRRERTATEMAMHALQMPVPVQMSQTIQQDYYSYLSQQAHHFAAPVEPLTLGQTPLDAKQCPESVEPKPKTKHTPPADALPYRTGLELTAIYKNWMGIDGYENGTDKAIAHYNEHIASTCKSRYRKNGGDFHSDGHCVEWATPVYDDWKTLKSQWEDFYRTMHQESYYPRHPDTVCGGGHIHVDLPNEQTNLRIQHLCYSYPVLPWLFTQAEDTDSANNPTKETWHHLFEKLTSDCFSQTKEFAVGNSKFKSNIIEFRFFQAAKDWTEQKLHIKFAHALVSYCANSNDVWQPAKLRTRKQLSAITKSQAVAMFKELCARIGFDWQCCEYLFKANLYPRWRKGYERT